MLRRLHALRRGQGARRPGGAGGAPRRRAGAPPGARERHLPAQQRCTNCWGSSSAPGWWWRRTRRWRRGWSPRRWSGSGPSLPNRPLLLLLLALAAPLAVLRSARAACCCCHEPELRAAAPAAATLPLRRTARRAGPAPTDARRRTAPRRRAACSAAGGAAAALHFAGALKSAPLLAGLPFDLTLLARAAAAGGAAALLAAARRWRAGSRARPAARGACGAAGCGWCWPAAWSASRQRRCGEAASTRCCWARRCSLRAWWWRGDGRGAARAFAGAVLAIGLLVGGRHRLGHRDRPRGAGRRGRRAIPTWCACSTRSPGSPSPRPPGWRRCARRRRGLAARAAWLGLALPALGGRGAAAGRARGAGRRWRSALALAPAHRGCGARGGAGAALVWPGALLGAGAAGAAGAAAAIPALSAGLRTLERLTGEAMSRDPPARLALWREALRLGGRGGALRPRHRRLHHRRRLRRAARLLSAQPRAGGAGRGRAARARAVAAGLRRRRGGGGAAAARAPQAGAGGAHRGAGAAGGAVGDGLDRPRQPHGLVRARACAARWRRAAPASGRPRMYERFGKRALDVAGGGGCCWCCWRRCWRRRRWRCGSRWARPVLFRQVRAGRRRRALHPAEVPQHARRRRAAGCARA